MDPTDPIPPDADTTRPDASDAAIDARPDAIDADVCAWTFTPEYVDPCAPGKPRPDFDLDLSSGGPYAYDTTDGAFDGPDIPDELITDEDGVHTIWVRDVRLGDDVTLRVTGNRPLMIVASGTIRIEGTIDASSKWNVTAEEYDRGPGLPSDECMPAAAGSPCEHGGGGGGGGGFGGAGGRGGDGGGERGCPNDTTGAPGGAGGLAVPTPTKIRAGCDGAQGGAGDMDNAYGVGGAGGGAVHLVASTNIDIEGTIHVGGAGGAPGKDHRSAGGGGGSGGYIGLEAPDIEIDRGTLAANGGGGGGGTNTLGGAQPGADGKPDGTAAAGGGGHSNGNGASGSDIATLNGGNGGIPPQEADRGGGGGGGGAGFIILYRDDTPTLSSSPVISPPFTQP